MSAIHAVPITDPVRDQAPPIRTHDGHERTPLLGN
jgi:hypothetical protein